MKNSRLFTIIMSAFAAVILFTGCPSPTATPVDEPDTPPAVEYVNVTFDAGTGAVFSNGEQTLTQSVQKGQSVTLPVPVKSDENKAKIFEFKHYTVNDTDTVYVANTPFTANTTLKAVYGVKAPTNINLTRNAECTQLTIDIFHPSDEVTYNITVTDQTETAPDEAITATSDSKTKTITGLSAHHTYKVEVSAVYVDVDDENKEYTSSAFEKSVNMLPFYTITYDFGTPGNYEGNSTYTVQADENTTYIIDHTPTISDAYQNIYTFSHYETTDATITDGKITVTSNITLTAKYNVVAPTNVTLTKKNEEATIMTVQIEHPSDQIIFTIEVTDAADSSSTQTITGSGKTKDVTGLVYSHTYNVRVWAVFEGDSSEATSPVSITMKTFYTVYYDTGLRGTINKSQTYSEQVERGTSFTAVAPDIMTNYQNIFEFKHYIIDNDPSKILTDNYNVRSNISIQAVYSVVAPSNVKTYITEPFDLKVTFDHPIADPAAKGVKFEILLEDITYQTPVAISEQQTAKIWTTNQLRYRHAYKVSVSTICESEESERIAIEFCPTEPAHVPVLLLMYMDGDNNLNDPIFFDLNEAEYGLYQAGAAADNVKVIALFDGGPRQGDGYENQFGFADTRLLELGPHSGEVYKVQQGQLFITQQGQLLSDKTIDRSYDADWLEGREVEMNEKQTLKFFLEWATERYNADSIILQFSNHGGGPRSYMPKEAILPNGEKIKLHDTYGRRSMCWDDTTGGSEYFLKTSDLSDVFDELGFGTSKSKIKMIIEDVCLGGSIEEAYELKNYADYLLASPNTIPGFGMDYVNLVNTLCTKATTSGLSNANAELFAKSVIIQYRSDYAQSDSFWCDMVKQYLGWNVSSLQALYNKCVEMYGSADANSAFNYYLYTLSTLADVSTLSLIKLSDLDTVVSTLNGVVEEFLTYADTNCTNYFVDTDSGRIVNQASETTVPIKLKDVFVSEVLLPGDAIYYQGTYSWLHDLGYVLYVMNTIANKESLTNLTSKLTLARTALTLVIKQAWRDGWGFSTYSTLDAGEDSWLGTQPVYQYGLTISGEALKTELQADGKYHVVNGYYPTWYTDLKFGQDCKWNDLLQACFPNQ